PFELRLSAQGRLRHGLHEGPLRRRAAHGGQGGGLVVQAPARAPLGPEGRAGVLTGACEDTGSNPGGFMAVKKAKGSRKKTAKSLKPKPLSSKHARGVKGGTIRVNWKVTE